MDDRSIIKLFFDRDEDGIKECESKYKSYCMGIAYGILEDTHDSEECVADALLAAWNTIPPKNPENLRTYLAKLVRNSSLNRYKMYRREKRGGTNVDVSLDEIAACLPSGDLTDKVVDSVVLSELLNRFLSTLRRDVRIMFVQKYWYFRSVGEIAAELSVSKSKVKVTLMRTREALAKFLENEGL